MKKIKIIKNNVDENSIHFSFATDARHLNVNNWQKLFVYVNSADNRDDLKSNQLPKK